MNNSIWALWLTLSYEVANMYFSVGIVTALVLPGAAAPAAA